MKKKTLQAKIYLKILKKKAKRKNKRKKASFLLGILISL
jgi:hypothetical protein